MARESPSPRRALSESLRGNDLHSDFIIISPESQRPHSPGNLMRFASEYVVVLRNCPKGVFNTCANCHASLASSSSRHDLARVADRKWPGYAIVRRVEDSKRCLVFRDLWSPRDHAVYNASCDRRNASLKPRHRRPTDKREPMVYHSRSTSLPVVTLPSASNLQK